MSLATSAIGRSRLWVARQNQRAKNVCAGPEVRVRPEVADPLLEGPGPGDLEVTPLEASEGRPLRGGHGLGTHEPEGPSSP